MSIRPTDLQIIVQKAQEIERLQQAQQQQPKTHQQQIAEKLHKQHEIEKRHINSTPHTDEVRIHSREESPGRSPQQDKRKHHGGEPQPEAKDQRIELSEHIIDIKI